MPTTERRVDLGARRARTLRSRLGDELREARIAAGVSQVSLGRALGISHAHVSRLEHARVVGASLDIYCRAFALLGSRVAIQVYPEGTPLRDAAHAALLERFRRRLPPPVRLLTERPVGIAGDSRAWDATIVGLDRPVRVEAETRLRDLQAVDRRIALKEDTDRATVVLLVLADTENNRRVIREHRRLLEGRYPVTPRSVLTDLRSARAPRGNGILLI